MGLISEAEFGRDLREGARPLRGSARGFAYP
jgi:hypothetical protein